MMSVVVGGSRNGERKEGCKLEVNGESQRGRTLGVIKRKGIVQSEVKSFCLRLCRDLVPAKVYNLITGQQ